MRERRGQERPLPGGKVVVGRDAVAIGEQAIDQGAADEARATGHQGAIKPADSNGQF